MLQLINKSLAPQCLAASDREDDLNGCEKDHLKTIDSTSSLCTVSALKKNVCKRRKGKKAGQHSAAGPNQFQQQPIPDGLDMMKLSLHSGPPPPVSMDHVIHRPVDSFMGPEAHPSAPVQYSDPPFAGPFNYPPPPVGYPFMPPPVGPVPFLPPQDGQHSSRALAVPRFGQRRTSTPLPGPRREFQPKEEGYARFTVRLEREGVVRPRFVPLGPVLQTPCQAMVIPVGFLPNGCYGPMLPGVYQYPLAANQYPQAMYHHPQVVYQRPPAMYPGGIYTAPMAGPVRMTNV